MLYDPKWEQETKAGPFTLESLIAWLEKQPTDTVYCFANTGHCLIAQYAIAMGFENVSAGGNYFRAGHGSEWLVEHELFPRESGIAAARPHTFGAALDRARAELAKQRTR